MNDATGKGLNRNGNKRGMSPNSRKNLDLGREGNNHAKKDCNITPIQRGMMGELCPYAKDPTWTWAYALAEAGMKDALTEEKARENLKDRIEGKIALPTEPLTGKIVIEVIYANRGERQSPSLATHPAYSPN